MTVGIGLPSWEKWLLWILRVLIFSSGVFQILFGNMVVGILILLCFGVLAAPSVFTRHIISFFPPEIEIVLLLMILIQFVLGEAHDLYNVIPYYDKFVHYMIPFFIGYLGFLLAYVMYRTGHLKAPMPVIIALIIVLALGLGAMEEIGEYLSDEMIYPRVEGWHHFQGNAQEDALHDTMNDLIADTLGGVFGSLLGVWFIARPSLKENPRLGRLVNEVEAMFDDKASLS